MTILLTSDTLTHRHLEESQTQPTAMSVSTSSATSNFNLVYKNSLIVSSIVFYITAVLNFVKSFIYSTDPSVKDEKVSESTTTAKDDNSNRKLFPSLAKFENYKLESSEQCSTRLGTKLVPIKTENGELEWKFVETDDDGKALLENSQNAQDLHDANNNFNIPSAEFFDRQLAKIELANNCKQPSQHQQHQHQQFSPVSEASSSHESQIENLKLSSSNQQFNAATSSKKVQLASPLSSTSNDLSPLLSYQQQLMKNSLVDLSPQSSNKSQSSVESSGKKLKSDDEMMDDEEEDEIDPQTGELKVKSHECPHCSAKFRVRGYLTRHIKKHYPSKLYMCPFFDPTLGHKCHATGGFSRRDTYKTHLKARHFKYPSGTKSSARLGTVGWCALCGQSFANNEIWVENHIESGECPGLPKTYEKRDSSKKKTGKRSLMLDAVSVNTPPPLDLKNSSCSSAVSTPLNINSPKRQATTVHTVPIPVGNKNHSPLSTSYSPPVTSINQNTSNQGPQQDNFDAFYYQPTQYEPIYPQQAPQEQHIVAEQAPQELEEDYPPLDDGFYVFENSLSHAQETNDTLKFFNPQPQQPQQSIKQQSGSNYYSYAFDKFRNQFPDFGI